MNRGDYITHLVLAGVFFGVLSPFLMKEGLVLGTGLYCAGTTVQLTIASVARVFSGE